MVLGAYPTGKAARFGDSISHYTGWFTKANLPAGFRFWYPLDLGGSGEETAAILARIAEPVAFLRPGDLCVVEGGFNDIGAHATPDTAACIANLTAIYAALAAAGIHIVAGTVYPTSSMTTAAQLAAIITVDNFIRAYSSALVPFRVAEWQYVMSLGGDGQTPDPALTLDGVHPNDAGTTLMAAALAPILPVI